MYPLRTVDGRRQRDKAVVHLLQKMSSVRRVHTVCLRQIKTMQLRSQKTPACCRKRGVQQKVVLRKFRVTYGTARAYVTMSGVFAANGAIKHFSDVSSARYSGTFHSSLRASAGMAITHRQCLTYESSAFHASICSYYSNCVCTRR